MKKCPKCGQIYPDVDEFCDECGERLYSVQTGNMNKGRSSQTSGRGKSPVPIIIGCIVAAAVLIGGTVLCVNLIGNRSKNEEASVSKGQEAVSQVGEEKKRPRLSSSAGSEETIDDMDEADDIADEILEGDLSEEGVGNGAILDHEGEAHVTVDDQSSNPQTTYETYYVVNCQESITLRKSPSTNAGEICQIPFGAAVSYVETAENGFYKIIYNGKTGYGLAAYLDVTAQAQPKAASDPGTKASAASAQQCYVAHCHESITLRTSASTSASEICQIPLGASVTYLDAAENGFYRISYNGNTGYALASYLEFGEAETSVSYMQVVNCKKSITLRKTPSTKGEEFCQIPLGEVVEFLGTAENGFYMVSYNGYTGYALASYLTEW
ncbi:MAG: hypothetical protein EOM40_13665 [Clostridia bacterium]|nr:hypothetical protein [Clostridia bacterium]NCC43417.1 hypothetical protein [Clostridia bacterium]